MTSNEAATLLRVTAVMMKKLATSMGASQVSIPPPNRSLGLRRKVTAFDEGCPAVVRTSGKPGR